MVIEDRFVVPAPMDRTWALLTDVPRVSRCMPGVTLSGQRPDGRYEGQLKVKVGPISSTFKGTATVSIHDAPGPVSVQVDGKDRFTGTVVVGTTTMTAAPLSDQETEITYSLDVNIRGRLGQLAQGVMRDTAKRMTREFAQCVSRELGAVG